ncbi:MAG: hypothetical protein U1F30_02560 [Steroidobacteraceae bacterium]
MSDPTAQHRRAFVERQLALQQERGAGTLAAAAESLRRALPADHRAEIDRLEADLAGRSATATPEREALVAVVAVARERGGAALAAYASARTIREASRQALDGLLFGIGAQVQYLLTLLLVLVAVAGTYSTLVYPKLAEAFTTFGTVAPPMTEFLFGQVQLIWLLILVAGALVLGARWVLARSRRMLEAGDALPERLARWPVLGAVVRSQRRWLALQWMAVLHDAGVGRAAAREGATARFGAMSEPDGGTLEAAEALGTLRAELSAQMEAQQAEVVRAATRARTWVVFALRLIVFWIIAIAVIGMYAPIFGLGTVV